MSEAAKRFATVYVTIASVLLGLALEDLAGVVRGIEHRDAFVWITSIFIVHITMNAWIGYSSIAISVSLEPNPWDALNVFVLAASHFALNSFVGAQPTYFFFATAVYSLTGGAITQYNVWRASQDPRAGLTPAPFRRVVVLNVCGAAAFAALGGLSSRGALSPQGELICVASALPFATAWLVMFWRSWARRRGAAA